MFEMINNQEEGESNLDPDGLIAMCKNKKKNGKIGQDENKPDDSARKEDGGGEPGEDKSLLAG